MSTIKKINPLNKEEERKKFLFDPLYNPQFLYEEDVTAEEYEKFGQISDQYLELSKNILDTVIKKYGSEGKYLDAMEGPIMEREEVETILYQYLKENKIDQVLKVHFTRNIVSRTVIDQDDLWIRLPIDYRKNSFMGILHHEVGTHYFRTLNERLSPWYQNRKQYGLSPKTQTEEGLALIHQFIDTPEPYLWITAIYYFASWHGNKMSFADLNKELQKYIEDPDRRWKMCLRVKRGLKDTSMPGAFSRNQAYLNGVTKVLHYLEEHEYNPEPMYAGKVDVSDVKRAREFSPDRQYLMPEFLKKMSPEEYKKNILRIKKFNNLP